MHELRVLIVSPKRTGIGGVAQHVSKLGEKLIELGHEVDYLSCEDLPCLKIKGLANPSFMVLSAFSALARRLKKKYDVVHAHNIPSCIAMRLTPARRVLTLHGVYSEQIKYLHGGVAGKISSYLENKALEWADAVTAVSKATAEWYRKRGVNVKYVPNAIDPADLPSEELKLFDKQIVFIGRLSKEKGPDILLKAFKQLDTDAHLLFIGDGPLRSQLETEAEGYNHIHFLGYKPRHEALKILKASDIFVLPSRHEGLSTALLEAMALKVPIIATRIAGNLELIDENSGMLVDPENPKQLAEAIAMLLSNNDKAKRLAENAYNKAMNKYNWNVVIHLYLKIYEENSV